MPNENLGDVTCCFCTQMAWELLAYLLHKQYLISCCSLQVSTSYLSMCSFGEPVLGPVSHNLKADITGACDELSGVGLEGCSCIQQEVHNFSQLVINPLTKKWTYFVVAKWDGFAGSRYAWAECLALRGPSSALESLVQPFLASPSIQLHIWQLPLKKRPDFMGKREVWCLRSESSIWEY